jgi:hypothetical protein
MIKLKDDERQAIRKSLLEYMEKHPISENSSALVSGQSLLLAVLVIALAIVSATILFL